MGLHNRRLKKEFLTNAEDRVGKFVEGWEECREKCYLFGRPLIESNEVERSNGG